MKHYKAGGGLSIEWVEDDNGKRTPLPVSLGGIPKRHFPKPGAKVYTPWELHQIKQFLLEFLKRKEAADGKA